MTHLSRSVNRRLFTISFAIVIVVSTVSGAGTASAESPSVAVERENLRTVSADGLGVVFSTWQEAGRRWATISRDQGESWSEPRALIDEIPLRAGTIIPGESAPSVPKSLAAGDDNRVFIVQFETRSLEAWRRQLGALGVEVLKFIPHNSHLVRMDPAVVATVEAQPFVRWIGEYEPMYRIGPELLAELDEQNLLTRHYNLMTFTRGPVEKGRLAAEVENLGGHVVVAHPEGFVIEALLTDAQVFSILASNHLQWIDEWSAPEDDMDIGRVIAGADSVLATPGGYDGTGVRAEVMDGGVDTDHPDFINPVPIHGTVDSAGTSHGTCTYGINFGNGSGNAAATGMVPGAYGYFAYYNPIYNGTASRYTHTAELVDPSLEYKCVYQSNSWGNTQTTVYNSYSAEMDDIIWQYDILIFQSQSNTGNRSSRPQAWAKNIVAVGGARHYNDANTDNDAWANGASIGPAADGRIKPDLTFHYDWTLTTDADPGGYVSGLYRSDFGGTSGATPMAAGTSGLFFHMWEDNVWGTAPGTGTVFEERPHFSTMKALLINNAEQYDWLGPNPDLTRVRQGWGRPNAQNAYDRAPKTMVVDETSILRELDVDVYTAAVPASQDALKVTMVYSDRAAVPSASIHRINDVSLKVIAPDGSTVYYGNEGLSNGLWSTPGGSADDRNTVENVFVQSPAEGDWTIEVHAVEVNEDVHIETPETDQDYALVVYGVTKFSGESGAIFVDGFESGNTDAWSFVVPSP